MMRIEGDWWWDPKTWRLMHAHEGLNYSETVVSKDSLSDHCPECGTKAPAEVSKKANFIHEMCVTSAKLN